MSAAPASVRDVSTTTHPAEAPTVSPRLSPSRAADFVTCPLLYRYRTIDRLPEPVSSAASRGTLVHAVLEKLFGLRAPERTLTSARSLVEPLWQELVTSRPELTDLYNDELELATATSEEEWLAATEPLLESYFHLEDPQFVEPAETELRVELALDSGLKLVGIIDRVDIAPDGRIRIIDYKSGRSPGVAFEGAALAQLKFYALMVWRTRGVIPTVLQLYYLGNRTVLSYEPTESDLIATERRVNAIWDAIANSLARREFVARPSASCRFCNFKSMCPAFDGTPPPLPDSVAAPVDGSGG